MMPVASYLLCHILPTGTVKGVGGRHQSKHNLTGVRMGQQLFKVITLMEYFLVLKEDCDFSVVLEGRESFDIINTQVHEKNMVTVQNMMT